MGALIREGTFEGAMAGGVGAAVAEGFMLMTVDAAEEMDIIVKARPTITPEEFNAALRNAVQDRKYFAEVLSAVFGGVIAGEKGVYLAHDQGVIALDNNFMSGLLEVSQECVLLVNCPEMQALATSLCELCEAGMDDFKQEIWNEKNAAVVKQVLQDLGEAAKCNGKALTKWINDHPYQVASIALATIATLPYTAPTAATCAAAGGVAATVEGVAAVRVLISTGAFASQTMSLYNKEHEKGGSGTSSGELQSKQTRLNQISKQIERGQAPRGIVRVDPGRIQENGVRSEQPHVHFSNGAALNKDGSWKHGCTNLTNEQKKWLESHNWMLPTS